MADLADLRDFATTLLPAETVPASYWIAAAAAIRELEPDPGLADYAADDEDGIDDLETYTRTVLMAQSEGRALTYEYGRHRVLVMPYYADLRDGVADDRDLIEIISHLNAALTPEAAARWFASPVLGTSTLSPLALWETGWKPVVLVAARHLARELGTDEPGQG